MIHSKTLSQKKKKNKVCTCWLPIYLESYVVGNNMGKRHLFAALSNL